MKPRIINQPDESVTTFLTQQIVDFNWKHWEVDERLPLAVIIENNNNDIIAGSHGRTFGDWLMLDILWVSDTLRGQGAGSKILSMMEQSARERGCTKVVLDTLDFQARTFYEQHGYTVQWTQEGYPKTGARHFMTKHLVADNPQTDG